MSRHANIMPGDVVRLLSGGPDMTAQEVVGESAVCVWFEELGGPGNTPVWGELRTRTIRASALTVVRRLS